MEEDRKKLQMQALQNLLDKNKDQRQKTEFARRAGPDRSQNLAKGTLDQDVLKVKQGSSIIPPEAKTKFGTTEKINTIGDVQPQISGEDFALKNRLRSSMKAAIASGDENMMASLRKVAGKLSGVAGKGLKALPIIGGLASAVGSENAAAAIPGLDSADSVGMSSADESQMIAETQGKIDYSQSQAAKDKQAALAKLLKSSK